MRSGGPVTFQVNGFLENGQPCIYEFTVNIPACDGETNTKINANPTATTSVKVVLAPNPAKEQVTLYYTDLPNASVLELYDITGRQIAAYNINGNDGDLTVPTNMYPTGIYIVVVRTAKGLLSQQKLVIE